MSVPTRRRPLVFATDDALEQARSLLPPGSVLEVEVSRSTLTRWARDGRRDLANGHRYVHGDGWTAVVERTVGRLNPERRAWLVVEVVPSRRGGARA